MKKLLLFFLALAFTKNLLSENIRMHEKKYECLTETKVSGLFQFERKFLKETDFFPDKTTLNFSENYNQN